MVAGIWNLCGTHFHIMAMKGKVFQFTMNYRVFVCCNVVLNFLYLKLTRCDLEIKEEDKFNKGLLKVY